MSELSVRENRVLPGTECARSESNKETQQSQAPTMAQRLVVGQLKKLRHGCLQFDDGNSVQLYGDINSNLSAKVRVNDRRVYQRMLRGGSLGAAEAYLDGEWDSDDLTNVIRIFARNLNVQHQQDSGVMAFFGRIAAKALHWANRNTKVGSRRNIEAHYDLGNDFFEQFLDETMMYSSAIFEDSSMTLAEASAAKLDRICRKLKLGPNDHVVEIGTGWGGFAHHAAANYGCRVTTTTISKEQRAWAVDRIQNAGLTDKVDILLEDYRDLTGRYDKLVSIEMIEAVGAKYLDTYFEKCGSLLKPNGAMAIQGIVMPEQRYDRYLKNVDFIQKYIFPGGCLPSVGAIGQAVASKTDMRILHTEDIAPHYARTLREWRSRFFNKLEQIRSQGYSERFLRMWEYYFCYCEAAFEERVVGTVQMVFARPGSRLDTVGF